MPKYKTYTEYKDSGVEWLGKVPAEWKTLRLGQYFIERREKVSDKDYIPLSVTMKGIVPQLENAAKSDAGDNRKLVRKGDFVINSRSDRKGSSGISLLDGSVSLISIVITPRGLLGAFTHHLLRSYSFQEEFYRFGKGIVADLWSTNYSSMKNIIIPIPSFLEQQKIASFLDHETGKIDKLIKEQEELIDLLQEKRQAVISHAVTKGLDPTVPMKDSGVEWLGKIPKHWEMKPLKYLCSFSGGGTPSKDNLLYWTNGNVPWVSPKDMKTFWITNTQDKITERAINESSTNMIKPGALLIVVRSGILQRMIPIAINKVIVTLNQDMKALCFNLLMHTEYAANFILGNQKSLLLQWSKQGATVESIEHEYLANSLFPTPPLSEQKAISEFLNKTTEKIDNLISKAKSAIELLKERRTALISAAVTGKIDVREFEI